MRDFYELQSLSRPPTALETACRAVLHVQAGISLYIETNSKGRGVNDDWNACQKMMGRQQFLTDLDIFTNEINNGNVPQHNIETARRVKDSMGENFSYEHMRRISAAGAGLCV